MKLFLKVIVALIAAAVAWYVFMQLLGVVAILAYIAAFFFVVGLVVYLCFPGLFRSARKVQPASTGGTPKLWSQSGTIVGYVDKPNVKQIATGNADRSVVIQLESDDDVKVLEDDGDIVLKVKITSGQEKGSVVWVERNSIKGYRRQ